MKDGGTNEGDTGGKEVIKPVENNKETDSELEKLKAANVEFAEELVKAKTMQVEMQKIQSEKLLGGESGGHIEPENVNPAKKMADEIVGAF
ncbi:hypothetical protein LCGC14_2276920 [marine sediment metagenome]|uniref:Uncharacterized protein n=1 Tax=marine sediment metagenome TaxID=412755 RepID=A0A0F9FQJ9_9ZZZZ